MRTELSETEKLAREISPVDSGALYFGVNDKTLDEQIDNYHREKWNDSVQKIEDKFANHEQKLQEVADEYAKKLEGVQIAPIGNYVIVRPFKENPFQKVQVSSSGLIISTGGMAPEIKRNDSGEYEEAENPIRVGVVIEAGPECKWLKSGDTIMWTVMSEVCIPFYNFGFKLVNETRALCVINDDLNERFNLSK
jgi:hypothetical protein